MLTSCWSKHWLKVCVKFTLAFCFPHFLFFFEGGGGYITYSKVCESQGYISKCLFFHIKESTPKISPGGDCVKFSEGRRECTLVVKSTQNFRLDIPGLKS